jgi:hypothetical protein
LGTRRGGVSGGASSTNTGFIDSMGGGGPLNLSKESRGMKTAQIASEMRRLVRSLRWS